MNPNTFVSINSNIIKENIQNIRNSYPDYQYYFGVVKGNCYGHSYGIIPSLKAGGINYLAVSSLSEALEVRKIEEEMSILIFEPISLNDLEIAATYNFTITIHDINYYEQLLLKSPKEKIKVHLKIDSGMNRLGIKNKNEVKKIVNELQSNKYFYLEGIYTHFATDGLTDPYWDKQMLSFQEITSGISLKQIQIIHLGRSSTLLHHQKIPFANGIRLGIVQYGINYKKIVDNSIKGKLRQIKKNYLIKKYQITNTIEENNLIVKPAFSMHSQVIQVKIVEKGDKIGYGSLYTAKEKMYIAIVPVGFSSGFSKKNIGGDVIINYKRYQIITSINMNLLCLKVDPQVRTGNNVTLIGQDISVFEVARRCQISSYELFTAINANVPRKII